LLRIDRGANELQPAHRSFAADFFFFEGRQRVHAVDPDSATTSFFMVLGPAPNLDSQYSAFGRVIDGMDTLAAFEKEEVSGETPVRRLELVRATIDPK
ncbi:MAG: peptidylprolyl isomerase, partial [Bryobacteraceae bacterium]